MRDFVEFLPLWARGLYLQFERIVQYQTARLKYLILIVLGYMIGTFTIGMAVDWVWHPLGLIIMLLAWIAAMVAAVLTVAQVAVIVEAVVIAEPVVRGAWDASKDWAPGEQTPTEKLVTAAHRDAVLMALCSAFAVVGFIMQIVAITPLHEDPVRALMVFGAGLVVTFMAIAWQGLGIWLIRMQRWTLALQVLIIVAFAIDGITRRRVSEWLFDPIKWGWVWGYLNNRWVWLGLVITLLVGIFLIFRSVTNRATKKAAHDDNHGGDKAKDSDHGHGAGHGGHMNWKKLAKWAAILLAAGLAIWAYATGKIQAPTNWREAVWPGIVIISTILMIYAVRKNKSVPFFVALALIIFGIGGNKALTGHPVWPFSEGRAGSSSPFSTSAGTGGTASAGTPTSTAPSWSGNTLTLPATQAGQWIEIGSADVALTASGTIDHGGKNATPGGSELKINTALDWAGLPDQLPLAGLVAKVGDNGKPFLVENGKTIKAGGRNIFLAINDTNAADNTGSFTITRRKIRPRS